jgi:uncharacterized RDD family membrane protein YckC
MSQGYGPGDLNPPGQGQPSYPPPPPPAYGPPGAYGAPGVGAYGTPAEPAGFYMGHRLANWPQRVGAYLIDLLSVAVPVSVAIGLLAGSDRATGADAAIVSLLYLIGLGVSIYNRWILQGRTGQSWGKRALGLKLLRMDNGQPIGGALAFARDLLHTVDALACYLGLLWPIWDARRQTFADKIINTVVIAD